MDPVKPDCCPEMKRCLLLALVAAPLVIVALACSNSGAPSTPAASKPAPTEAQPTKAKEPVTDPR